MNPSFSHDARLGRFPSALLGLLEAELAAGNAIVEIASSFPAPPAGAYVMLARRVSTRPRASGDGLVFHERNSSQYSGEFSDPKRHFFVLEPPRPPEPEQDMDVIRAARQPVGGPQDGRDHADTPPASRPSTGSQPERVVQSDVLDRFRASMVLDYEKWREGIGYDLTVLREATAGELAAIEDILARHQPRDWRDVEALAAIGSPRARVALREALGDDNASVRMAVHRFVPELVSERERTASLVSALERAEFFGGLTEALGEVQRFHPPEILEALWRGLREREGGVAVHFAAMLWCLHGKAASAFDWKERPFFLRFNTADPAARGEAIRELRARLFPSSLEGSN